MKKRYLVQLVLLLTGFTLIILTYFYYPNLEKKKEVATDDTLLEDNFQKKDDSKKSTTFESVVYEGLYDLDKPFSVEAENAYITEENSDIVYMNGMKVSVFLTDGRIVTIMSSKGRYNKATFDCFFENNVRATDGQTQIFSNNLDLLATKDFVEIYNDVNLKYPTGSLIADKIDYNFNTKYFKVSMFDDTKIEMKIIK